MRDEGGTSEGGESTSEGEMETPDGSSLPLSSAFSTMARWEKESRRGRAEWGGYLARWDEGEGGVRESGEARRSKGVGNEREEEEGRMAKRCREARLVGRMLRRSSLRSMKEALNGRGTKERGRRWW